MTIAQKDILTLDFERKSSSCRAVNGTERTQFVANAVEKPKINPIKSNCLRVSTKSYTNTIFIAYLNTHIKKRMAIQYNIRLFI